MSTPKNGNHADLKAEHANGLPDAKDMSFHERNVVACEEAKTFRQEHNTGAASFSSPVTLPLEAGSCSLAAVSWGKRSGLSDDELRAKAREDAKKKWSGPHQ